MKFIVMYTERDDDYTDYYFDGKYRIWQTDKTLATRFNSEAEARKCVGNIKCGEYKVDYSVIKVLDFDEVLDELQEALRINDRHEDVTFFGGAYQIEVTWGDWKHDHAYICNFVKGFFEMHGIMVKCDQEVTEENGTDAYSAVCTFTEVK